MKKLNLNEKDKKAYIEGAGIVEVQDISSTLEENYMPYAMSVIISRALPEIDGFKPSHRKILYTMYKMGLLNGTRTKSANVVGQTMKLNPHGDMAIYETLVRLSRGYEALIHPYIDSKGNFGKSYSRDMAFAASRYTEVRLATICNELFRDIDKDTVDFVFNYDNTMKEPTLLPSTFPSILVNSNIGIAVGMASSISSFNLHEICETTINLIKDENFNIKDTLKAPDFSTGGFIIYDEEIINNIYTTGRGSVKVRCRYSVDKDNSCIDITEIPPSTTVEAIIDKVVELVKVGKIKDISDIRDETDINGLKITVDYKRGVNPENLIYRLCKLTPLEDSFSCNFNVLINGAPKVLGVKAIILEWVKFRNKCVRRRLTFDLSKKQNRMHLLNGLEKILTDIDKAIKIIRETSSEEDVIPNLMIGFGIDNIQADYIAEIKLRHLNKEYILKRIDEINILLDDIRGIEDILKDSKKVDKLIIAELKDVIKKYQRDRKTMIIYDDIVKDIELEEVKEYSVNLFLSNDGYFKKITQQSFRMSNEQKLKDNDFIISTFIADNKDDILFFTDKYNVYKSKLNDFNDTKSSALGEFLASKLGLDPGENVKFMVTTSDYSGDIIFVYENGRLAKVPLNSYETKTNRKKLLKAYNDKSKLVFIDLSFENTDYLMETNLNKALIVQSQQIPSKVTKNTQGIVAFKLRKTDFVLNVYKNFDENFCNSSAYRTKSLPSAGFNIKNKKTEQITF
ncbi:MAG: DNA gyrase subunit A [Oscillospiraceae bacterium]